MAPATEEQNPVVVYEKKNENDNEILMKLVGTVDSKASVKAGEIYLAKITKNGPKNVEEYLQGVKPLMCSYYRVKEDISKDDPDYRTKVLKAFFSDLDPVKTTEPNETWNWMWRNRTQLQDLVDFSFDKKLDYFSVLTMENTYLLRQQYKGKLLEIPQFMWLRVASALHYPNFDKVSQMYLDTASLKSIPASPTLFNAGLTFSQMSSCFLLGFDDSMHSILWKLHVIGLISKNKAAVGNSLGALRSGTPIGNNGLSEGTFKVERLINDKIEYVTQGGTRPGAAQNCLPIWHIDIFDHIDATKKTGNPDKRLKKADTSVGTYRLFWQRVAEEGDWSLFCPSQFFNEKREPTLHLMYGETFEKVYIEAEKSGKARKTVKARDLLDQISEVLIESGRPYVIDIDAINRKSNMKNIGTITTLNLCQEIALPTPNGDIASCNLSSICLRSLVDPVTKQFNWAELSRIAKCQVENLNAVIDRNYYMTPEIESTNRRTRPIGIGFQGAIDAILMMDLLYDSPEAERWIEKVVACVYYNALLASCELARQRGPYQMFEGSPYSQGKLQFDLWNEEADIVGAPKMVPVNPAEWGQEGDWDLVRTMVKEGILNSQLLTSQPTASVSVITGNGEAWEALYSNVFTRRTMNGDNLQVNRYLQKDLEEIGLWNTDTVDWIRERDGSIKGITEMVDTTDSKIIERLKFLEKKHRTIFEYSQKVIIRHASIRGPYIDGSQSTNLYMNDPKVDQVSAALSFAHKNRLKTLIYYLRTKEARSATKFTIRRGNEKLKIQNASLIYRTESSDAEAELCRREAGCITCQ